MSGLLDLFKYENIFLWITQNVCIVSNQVVCRIKTVLRRQNIIVVLFLIIAVFK